MFQCGDRNIAKRPEVRKKISEARRGKKQSEETKKKIGDASRGKTYEQRYGKEKAEIMKENKRKKNPAHSKRMSGKGHPLYGKHFSEKSRNLMSKTRKKLFVEGKLKCWNKGLTKETDERVRRGAKKITGEGHPMYGKQLSEEHKRKCSESLKGTKIGEDNPVWNGGSSFEPYSSEFNGQLKEKIRKRDNYTCQLCSKKNCRTIHHKDYYKKNSKEDNLVLLCGSCHGKTNFNRQWWIDYFLEI